MRHVLSLIALVSFLVLPSAALAEDFNRPIFQKNPESQVIPLPNLAEDLLGDNIVGNLLNMFVSLILVAGGLAAFGVILFAGFKYLTAGGNAGQTEQAKKMIVAAIVGIVIMSLSYLIVTFVIETAQKVGT